MVATSRFWVVVFRQSTSVEPCLEALDRADLEVRDRVGGATGFNEVSFESPVEILGHYTQHVAT